MVKCCSKPVGLSGSLDWCLQSFQYITPTRTLGILWILLERLNDLKNEDIEEYDEDMEISEKEENKEGLITENLSTWN